MSTMRPRASLVIVALLALALLGVLDAPPATAQGIGTGTPPPLRVSITLSAIRYLLNPGTLADPIAIDIRIENVSCATPTGCETVYVPAGFTTRRLHLDLVFTGPDGRPITADEIAHVHEEGPPPRVLFDANGNPIQVEPLDLLLPTYTRLVGVPDARRFYHLTQAGYYSVKAQIPIRTYRADVVFDDGGQFFAPLDTLTCGSAGSSCEFAGVIESSPVRFALVADVDGDGYAYPEPDSRISSRTVADCDDSNADVHPDAVEVPGNGIDDDCNPATPDGPTGQGLITVKAEKHTVGTGTRPGSTKEPLSGLPVAVFNRATGSCASGIGVSWQNFKSIWVSCPKVASGVTDTAGVVNLGVQPGNYLIIGEYDPDTLPLNGNEVYLGVSAGQVASGGSVEKQLQLIVRANGTPVPAKSTVLTGSSLIIIEPQYVEWDQRSELYPIILESVGNWSVTTSVSPPSGFVADYPSLSAAVNTSRQVVQFTVTEVGSDWIPTRVTHRITHNGKSQTVRTEIGVKLSERLARAKGLTRFGAPLPGPPRK